MSLLLMDTPAISHKVWVKNTPTRIISLFETLMHHTFVFLTYLNSLFVLNNHLILSLLMYSSVKGLNEFSLPSVAHCCLTHTHNHIIDQSFSILSGIKLLHLHTYNMLACE